jgi:hypothetical protein
MELKYFKFLDGVTTTAASATFLTDYRFNDVPQRTIQGVLTSDAHVQLYTYLDRDMNGTEHFVSTFTASSFSTVIEGPVAAIKVVMVSGGTATVDGLV